MPPCWTVRCPRRRTPPTRCVVVRRPGTRRSILDGSSNPRGSRPNSGTQSRCAAGMDSVRLVDSGTVAQPFWTVNRTTTRRCWRIRSGYFDAFGRGREGRHADDIRKPCRVGTTPTTTPMTTADLHKMPDHRRLWEVMSGQTPYVPPGRRPFAPSGCFLPISASGRRGCSPNPDFQVLPLSASRREVAEEILNHVSRRGALLGDLTTTEDGRRPCGWS